MSRIPRFYSTQLNGWVIFTVSFILFSPGFDGDSIAARKMATKKPCTGLWGFLLLFLLQIWNL